MKVDPVCGRDVDDVAINRPESQVFGGASETDPVHGTKRFHDGRWFYFCSLDCRQKFVTNPAEYLADEAHGGSPS